MDIPWQAKKNGDFARNDVARFFIREMDNRQEHIIRLVRDILPRNEARPHIGLAQFGLIGIFLFIGALGGSYAVQDFTRPLNYYEFVTLHSMVESSARRSSVSMNEMTARVLNRFRVTHLQEIKAHEWKEVLQYLSMSGR